MLSWLLEPVDAGETSFGDDVRPSSSHDSVGTDERDDLLERDELLERGDFFERFSICKIV